jgi:hypothetical protein
VIAGATWKVDYVRDSYSPLTDHLQKQDFDFATLRRADGLVRRGSSDAIPVIVAGHIQRTGQVINLRRRSFNCSRQALCVSGAGEA